MDNNAPSTAYVNQSEIYYGDIIVFEPKADNNAWINIGSKPVPKLVIEKTIIDTSGNYGDYATLTP